MIRIPLVIVTLLVAVGAGALIWTVVTPGSDALPKAGRDAEAATGPTAAAAPDRAPGKPVPGVEGATDSKPPAAPRVPPAPTPRPFRPIGSAPG